MKKSFLFSIRSSLCILLLLLSITIPTIPLKAAGYTVDHVEYQIYSHGSGANLLADSAHVVGTSSTGDVYIPSSISYTYTYTEKINGEYITLTRSVPCPVTAIYCSAFSQSGIQSFSMASSIRAYSDYLDFSRCANLKHASLGDLIKSYNFRSCESLTGVNLPQSTSNIGDYCFYDCISLANFDFGNLRHIGHYAFAHCNSLTHITIPESLETIGAGSFMIVFRDL